MLIVKRLVVWLLERLIEVLCLGGFLGLLLHLSFRGFWVYALAGGVVLFMHGYYFTTAFFGVIWRKAKWWFYPAITGGLFVAHAYFPSRKARFDPGSESH